jgi:hypothetical protein
MAGSFQARSKNACAPLTLSSKAKEGIGNRNFQSAIAAMQHTTFSFFRQQEAHAQEKATRRTKDANESPQDGVTIPASSLQISPRLFRQGFPPQSDLPSGDTGTVESADLQTLSSNASFRRLHHLICVSLALGPRPPETLIPVK